MNKDIDTYRSLVAKLTHRLICGVNDFNASFAGCEESFLFGNCYWYARILKERFSPWCKTEIMYNQVENHFCCCLTNGAGSFLADIRGVFTTGIPDGWKKWEDYIVEEPIDAARVYRDCIWHIDPESFDKLPKKFKLTPWELEQPLPTEQDCTQEDCQESQK